MSETTNTLKQSGMENLDKFVGEMLNLLKDAKAFASEEIPKFLKEVLTYNLAKASLALFAICFFGAMGFVAGRLVRKHYQKEVEKWKKECAEWDARPPGTKRDWERPDRKPDDGALTAAITIQGISVGLAVLASLGWIVDILKISLAPRVFLLEYFTAMVK